MLQLKPVGGTRPGRLSRDFSDRDEWLEVTLKNFNYVRIVRKEKSFFQTFDFSRFFN